LQTKAKLNEFLSSINNLVLEDNSLIFREEAETGQYLLSGLGELHL
jgi:translation elongation factor EF-G